MRGKTKSKKFPYVVKSSMEDKILCLLFIPCYFYFLWGTFNQWNIADAQVKSPPLAFILGLSIALLIVILKVFFAKSILEDKWITKTNVFLMKRRIMYEEINDVGSTRKGVRLNLVDGSSVNLYCGNIVEFIE